MKSRRDRINNMLALSMMLGLLLITASQIDSQPIQPVPMPDPKIPGFKYPTPEKTIVWWTIMNDQAEINKHAWGIWTAITLETGQRFDKQNLRVFETWVTPQDLTDSNPSDGPGSPRPLEVPRQFTHGGSVTQGEKTILGFVKYDPTASQHILKYELLVENHLRYLLMTGTKKIPDFPFTAIALKPVFQSIAQKDLVDGRYYQMAAWPGPPVSPKDPLPGKAKPFPSTTWGQCIWIDVTNQSKGDGSVDTVCDGSGSSRKPGNTYNVNSFINFTLTAEEAEVQNDQARNEQDLQGPTPNRLAPGDYSVLQAMHVSSRETTRWTWQTFWWTPHPDNPNFPSSPEIAKARPAQLKGAARNYALAPAYSMLNPPQPYIGGENIGNSVYSYNPWLEAGFDNSVLPDSKPGTFYGTPVPNNVGIQTNCMSCHAQANYNIYRTGAGNPPAYTGDRYIDLSSPQFRGTLQVDFLWSLPNMAKNN